MFKSAAFQLESKVNPKILGLIYPIPETFCMQMGVPSKLNRLKDNAQKLERPTSPNTLSKLLIIMSWTYNLELVARSRTDR